ncbi:MAG: nucleotidyltransferase family protein [Hyphomicrobiales bacterium]|nr:nucleotidyltransferase family protein [Hyphomicrobiales bacterium]
MDLPADLLTPVLRDPTAIRSLRDADWDLLVRQGRESGLLGRVHHRLAEAGLLDSVPEAPRRHLEAEWSLAEKQWRDVRWEVECLRRNLAVTGVPIFLLKGAAYVLTGLPSGRGRLFGDVDLMVPRTALPEVEKELTLAGWRFDPDLDPYDDHYYRTWTHQIPPLTHFLRHTCVDVHHTIVPETARVDVNAKKLRDAARAVDGSEDLYVLAPADMVLHSAVHLFNEGQFERGLRDLTDLDLLMSRFAAEDAEFWSRLVARASELDLQRPLFYCLRYCRLILGTEVPEQARRDIARAVPVGGGHRWLMDLLFTRALRPHHHSCRTAASGAALWLLYVRSHYLRMPLRLLLPHLWRKAFRGIKKGDATADVEGYTT